MKHISMFIVITEREGTGNRFNYFEEGCTAQEVVDKVKTYIDDYEKIVFVFKQVENWK